MTGLVTTSDVFIDNVEISGELDRGHDHNDCSQHDHHHQGRWWAGHYLDHQAELVDYDHHGTFHHHYPGDE